ncbi:MULTISPECIES: tyrosine decarboxylase MfnA [Halomicrobium]|uniref:Probable L-aspartate decarboxylase n=2 Tax=Halomicrobium mukohataei TaxID=57705 RepID=C7P1L0_HALMD|nr:MULTISPECIES: tyrosine decarboxylase MfnA [Halomicrobium]ACV49100.1 Pyridoxal-dependent decarboxylase [Halomicrobium mukohataei DSM 12286]QCD64516.1 tyrosine decarboxylase MfnA [Halomicrobium mukohataei]QFR19322.1 tyrosine decarboxylase MfnA [Halomicrobium sp. ZPS1]
MQRAEPQSFERVLSSMCTEPHPTARKAAERFLATNPGDPGTYETVADLEREAVERLGTIAGLGDPAGYVTSGGTEANVQAIRIARNRGDTDDPNVVAPEHAHFSFTKAAELLGVELRTAPATDYRADMDAMTHLADDDTVAVVGVAGTTEYGYVDPIPAVADLADAVGALCHVDAAWGGFYLPFTDHDWHFGHADVDTLTIDPHKVGQAAVPAGGLLARSPDLLDELAIDTPYLESRSQVTLTGTRSGAGVASAVAAMDALWRDGYRETYERAMGNAEWLAEQLDVRGHDVIGPELPLVAADLSIPMTTELRDRGWRVSKTGSGEMRVVCMPHVTRSMLRSFVADLDWY